MKKNEFINMIEERIKEMGYLCATNVDDGLNFLMVWDENAGYIRNGICLDGLYIQLEKTKEIATFDDALNKILEQVKNIGIKPVTKKYFIVPIADAAGEYYAHSAEEALSSFAEMPDSDIAGNFMALTEEEFANYMREKMFDYHRRTVFNFMIDELEKNFGCNSSKAEEIANEAYELYAQGSRHLTEYEAIEEAYHNHAA